MSRRRCCLVCALPLLFAVCLTSASQPIVTAPQSPGSQAGSSSDKKDAPPSSVVVAPSGNTVPFPTVSRRSSPPAPTINCGDSILDQATGTTCLNASTTPTLGMLYPISVNLFVALTGEVGIGTTSPSATLDVAGTARVTDTLTLNPSGDQALDVSTGSIYKSGALFMHTRGGIENTALGRDALAASTGGYRNTAVGYKALFASEGSGNTAIGNRTLSTTTTGFGNTAVGRGALQYDTAGSGNTALGMDAMRFNNGYGSFNVAIGGEALRNNTTGGDNIAIGTQAMLANATGGENTACGSSALLNNTSGINNTAVGSGALFQNTIGSSNIALGRNAGSYWSTGSNNIAIGNIGVAAEAATIRVGTAGTHTRAFIAGIRGVTTGVANAVPVLVDSAGQLGTVSSSRRFKKDISDMGDLTQRLLELRPVVFRYKQEQTLPNGGEVPFEYGLIAEEVAEIFPDLVINDDEGKPFTVKYHMMSAMLLNELKKQARELEALRSEVTQLHALEVRLAAIESRVSRANSTGAIPADPR